MVFAHSESCWQTRRSFVGPVILVDRWRWQQSYVCTGRLYVCSKEPILERMTKVIGMAGFVTHRVTWVTAGFTHPLYPSSWHSQSCTLVHGWQMYSSYIFLLVVFNCYWVSSLDQMPPENHGRVNIKCVFFILLNIFPEFPVSLTN